MIKPTYFATGAQHERDLAAIRMPGLIPADAMMAGGPLDAPCYFPAGAHNSVEASDWRGRPVPYPSLSPRDAI